MKCMHINCNNESNSSICPGHISLILDESNSVLLCINCGGLIAVFEKEQYPTNKKYHWCYKCRRCGGTKEDETIMEDE